MASLYPGGDVTLAPADLVVAVTAALTVLSFSELPTDEVPPRNIWHHDERMKEWWASVKQRRGVGSSGSGGEPVPQATEGMDQNELTARYRR